MTLWLDLDIVREEWPDALVGDTALTAMLGTAQTQIIRYAPASLTDLIDPAVLPISLDETGDEVGGPLPDQLRTALLMQVREIWRASEREGDVVGIGEYAVRAPDLNTAIKKVLRPKRGVPILR